ncbi:hypothetical protein [Pseudomonas folii]|uniref:Uncharacterized protein n=1 Tax=Pseudomonas folii TaxID=2762593 RepID=A0ABR7B7P0_9PSED|nr:hypothetical protein [Pseudomonas folii]MBC3952925.1 hypothetical protein [Pseudomonas folii]
MYRLKLIAVLSALSMVGFAQAETLTNYHAEIRNMTAEDIYLINQSWDLGGQDPQTYRIKPGDTGGFNIRVTNDIGEVNFMMGTDGGKRCNFVVKYGPVKRVKGPMTLTGPGHWKVTKSFGSVPATCELKVDEWVYKESFDVRYRMK